MMRTGLTRASIGLAVLLLTLTGAVPAQAAGAPTSSARHLLAVLPVRTATHSAKSIRAEFGSWIDADQDGEDSRAEVLEDESTTPVVVGADGAVRSGRWTSHYGGKRITSASRLVVDHLVPLDEAWASGARTWSDARRQAFANDLGYGPSLIAVSAHDRRVRHDRDPAHYLPHRTYRCRYVRDWIAVKYRWHLAVDPAEKAALTSALDSCTSVAVRRPGKPVLSRLLAATTAPTPVTAVSPAPVATAEPSPAPTPLPTATTAPIAVSTPVPEPGATAVTPIVSSTPAPTPSATAPAGATAICRDGTYSYSATHSGTCSHHGGVSVWL